MEHIPEIISLNKNIVSLRNQIRDIKKIVDERKKLVFEYMKSKNLETLEYEDVVFSIKSMGTRMLNKEEFEQTYTGILSEYGIKCDELLIAELRKAIKKEEETEPTLTAKYKKRKKSN